MADNGRLSGTRLGSINGRIMWHFRHVRGTCLAALHTPP
jgi:hypothetical protein